MQHSDSHHHDTLDLILILSIKDIKHNDTQHEH